MQNKLTQYLAARGFSSNPFATTNAEQEKELLPRFFVQVSWFNWLVGNPQQPESLILFAPQGYGKTSHRIEVGRLASEKTRQHRALIVNFNDVNMLLQEEAGPVTISTYLPYLRRKVLQALKEQLEHFPECLARLQQDEEALIRFCALQRLYVPLRRFSADVPEDAVKELTQAYRETILSPREWLKDELFPLAQGAGFASVYVLIDGMDESSETRDNPDAMFQLLSPLLDAPGLLQGCGFAFKFFLPQRLEEKMKQQHVGRLDRIPNRSLSWTEKELVEILAKRMTSYSLASETDESGQVNSFADLCDGYVDSDGHTVDVDVKLARAANSSPRRLIDLARRIIEAHCEALPDSDSESDANTLISAETIDKVLEGRDVSPPDPDKVKELFYDTDHGEIWLGNTNHGVTLPKQLRRCMDCLWTHRHHTVTYEEMANALYYDDEKRSERVDEKGSLDKIVRRLRKVLEEDKPSSHTYIDVQPGTGYVLRNFRDE